MDRRQLTKADEAGLKPGSCPDYAAGLNLPHSVSQLKARVFEPVVDTKGRAAFVMHATCRLCDAAFSVGPVAESVR